MPALRNVTPPPARAIRLGSRILKGAAGGGGGGGGAPSVVVYKDAYTSGSAATRVLTQRTVATGDVVAVVGQTEDFATFSVASLAQSAGTAAIGAVTKQQEAGSASHCANGLFTFTVTGGGTLTLTATFSATPAGRNTTFWTYVATGCGGVGNTGKTTTSVTTITASLATSANSCVIAMAADWAASGGAATTLTPASPVPVLDAHETDGVADQVAAGSFFSSRGGHWADTGPAGTVSYGVTVPASASYDLVVCELLAGAGGAPQAGPPLYPPGHPVQARQLPLRGGHVSRAAGPRYGTGPALKPPPGPVRPQPAGCRGGSVTSRAGTFGGPGAPVKAAPGPVRARVPQAARGGRAAGRAGTLAAAAAVTLVNTAEGGTSGVTASPANTGGASGNAFDSVTAGAGATLAFDSTRAAHGTLSYKVATGGSAVASYAAWSSSLGSAAQSWYRLYLYVTATPAATTRVWQSMSGGTLSCRLDITTAGKLQVHDSASVSVFTTTASVPLNAWFRVEGYVIASATAGRAELKLFLSPDSVTADETQTSAASFNTLTSADAQQFGLSGATANLGPYWMDDVGASTAGYLGPSGTPAAPRAAGSPVRARIPQPARGGSTAARGGLFAGTGPAARAASGPVRAARQPPSPGGHAAGRTGTFTPAAPAAGPPVYPLHGPVRARQLPPRGGHVSRAAGPYGSTGPRPRAQQGPVRAQPAARRGGTAQGRTGTFTLVVLGAGPPVYPLHGPVQARRLPQRGGSTSSRAGAYGRTGSPVRPLSEPVKAQPGPARGGRTASRAGTFTAVVTGSGPPLYPPGHPVTARRQPAQGGRVIRRAGPYAGTGAPVRPASGPIGVWRRQPPPPARGRTASLRGPYAGTGPPAVPLHRPVRGQPARPLLTGRAAWRTGTWTAPFVPPFTIGALAAADKPGSVLTAAGASSALTAATAATGTLTAADQRTGGPG